MNALQSKLLTMLEWFHEFCVKNGLKYFIAGGTMLGAVRHQGFIPWDDDIDVVMPRKDYDRLMELLECQEDNYVLETPYSAKDDFIYSFAKLYDVTTTLTERQRKNCRRGVYIDIFPLDGVGNSIEESRKHYRKIDLWRMFLLTQVSSIRKERNGFKNFLILLMRLIPPFFVKIKKLLQKIDRLCKKKEYYSHKYVANLMSSYREIEIMERSIYGEPKEVMFEGIMVYGVENPDQYLTTLYGNWKELPPEEKRIAHHDFVELDLEKSYLKN